jgi:hypothetical protein
MKSMTRQQLAQCAGISAKTLKNWMKPFEQELMAMGMPQGKGLLPPNVVRWLAEKYCIDIEG